MVMGQEERKNKAKMEKTQIQLASTSNEYEAAVKALEETTGRWNRDWKAACDVCRFTGFRASLTLPQKFQDLEEERLDFTKSSLWTFANVASTVCVSDDGVNSHLICCFTPTNDRTVMREDQDLSRRLRGREGYNQLHTREGNGTRDP